MIVVALLFLAAGGAAVVYRMGSSKSGDKTANAASATPTTEGTNFLVQPADGTTGVDPTSSVSVTAMLGRLDNVTVMSAGGTPVAGSVTPNGTAWHSTGALAVETSYTVTIDATSLKGKAVQEVTHFQTLVPTETLKYSVNPTKGLTVGVGEPIVLRFNHPVPTASQAAVINNLQVTESNPVPGGWHWFTNEELHFRPQVYWPTGEQVSFTANLAGFNAGNGIWSLTNASTNFTVGDSHIATADVQAEQMTVTDNGNVVARYPISAGRSIYPTMNGVHIDLYRSQVVHMVSSTVGIPVNSPNGYDEFVYWDVNISDSGEFVHAAPWSVGEQGRANVSHGCVNLSTANAQSFFNFSRVGDVIQVVGSPRPPSLGDHGTMDWTEPWANFTPATILSASTGQPADLSSTTTTVPAPTTSTAPPAAPTTTVPPLTAATAPAVTVAPTTTTKTTVHH